MFIGKGLHRFQIQTVFQCTKTAIVSTEDRYTDIKEKQIDSKEKINAVARTTSKTFMKILQEFKQNKTGTSQVGAPLKAQKAQISKMCSDCLKWAPPGLINISALIFH